MGPEKPCTLSGKARNKREPDPPDRSCTGWWPGRCIGQPQTTGEHCLSIEKEGRGTLTSPVIAATRPARSRCCRNIFAPSAQTQPATSIKRISDSVHTSVLRCPLPLTCRSIRWGTVVCSSHPALTRASRQFHLDASPTRERCSSAVRKRAHPPPTRGPCVHPAATPGYSEMTRTSMLRRSEATAQLLDAHAPRVCSVVADAWLVRPAPEAPDKGLGGRKPASGCDRCQREIDTPTGGQFKHGAGLPPAPEVLVKTALGDS
jgi:hypothetical protein